MKKLQNRKWNNLRFRIGCAVDHLWLSKPLEVYDRLRCVYQGKAQHRKQVNSRTELVIEGFPSSANSFLVRCLQQGLKGRPLRYADHHHSAAMAVKAVRLRIPTVLCVREPLDTCLSAARRWPLWTVEEYLMRYVEFHQILIPYMEEMVVSDFDVTTKLPVKVITQVLAQVEGRELKIDEEDVKKRAAEQPGMSTKEIAEKKAREQKKREQLLETFEASGGETVLRSAREVYERFREKSEKDFKV